VPGLELARPLPLAERYRTRFNAEPTPNVLVAYDAVMIVAKADRARRHGETSLVNALKTIGDHNGAAGAYSYAEREWLPPVYMTRIQGGVPVPIR
jgi:ABC-type branched-subunit amino acid transport system substrate-binding protein